MRRFRFSPALPQNPPFTLGDGLILLGLVTLILLIAKRLMGHRASLDFIIAA